MRRDIDDIALSSHMSISGSRHFTVPGAQQPLTGYGRKDMDDMVRYSSHCIRLKISYLSLSIDILIKFYT